MKLNEARNTGALVPDADGFYTVVVGSFPDAATAEAFEKAMKSPKVIYDLKSEKLIGFSADREKGLIGPLFAVRALLREGDYVRGVIKPVGANHASFHDILQSDAPKSFGMNIGATLQVLGYDWVK